MMKQLRVMVSTCPSERAALCSLRELMHLCLQSMIHQVGCDLWGPEQIAKQEHNYGHNSIENNFPAANMLSPVWQVRQGIVRGQVSIKILCLRKTMFFTIFRPVSLVENSWKSCVFLPWSRVRILHGLGPNWK